VIRVARRFSLGLLGLTFVLCGAVACSSTTSRLKARFAREQACPEDRVAVSEAGGAVYRAQGCGHDTEYVCEQFAGMGDPSRGCRPDLVAPK